MSNKDPIPNPGVNSCMMNSVCQFNNNENQYKMTKILKCTYTGIKPNKDILRLTCSKYMIHNNNMIIYSGEMTLEIEFYSPQQNNV